jgi:ABC-2 type transport system permease protein
MLRSLRAEIRKLTTIRGPWLLLAAGPLIVAAGISGLTVSGGNVHDPGTQAKALGHVGLAAIFSLILGISAVAGEYRHGTITDSYLSFPGRSRLLAAKLAVSGAAGLAAGLACSVVALTVTAAWWSAKGGHLDLHTTSAWTTLAGGVGVNVGFALIGVSLGALIRNLVAAVAAALAWIVLIEGIVGQLLGSGLARWLPFSASEALGRSSLNTAVRLLPPWGGGLVLLGYAIVFGVAAVLITLRRDVI